VGNLACCRSNGKKNYVWFGLNLISTFYSATSQPLKFKPTGIENSKPNVSVLWLVMGWLDKARFGK
jgi:hypothetical protein